MRGGGPVKINRHNVAEVFSIIENIHNIDLRKSSTREAVSSRRIVVNYILAQTGWSVTELHRVLRDTGVTGQGLSRRSLAWYKTTQDEILSSSPGAAINYSATYNATAVLLQHNL